MAASPLRWRRPHQELVLYLTWNGLTADAWRAARRAMEQFESDSGLRLQAANLAKECDPTEGVKLARAAQVDALVEQRPRAEAWATLCLSLSLRWQGDIDQAAEQAQHLAGGLDAIAGPVWRACGLFELGAVAALRDDADVAVVHLREAREVFVAAGAHNFVFDALCAELAAQRQRRDGDIADVYGRARTMLDRGLRASRFAREVLLVEEGEIARAAGRLADAHRAYSALADSPTLAQRVLGLLGLGEIQRARGERPDAAVVALRSSQELGFGYGEVHAAVTLGLTGAITGPEAEAIIAASLFKAPARGDVDGLLRFCVGPDPRAHVLCFP